MLDFTSSFWVNQKHLPFKLCKWQTKFMNMNEHRLICSELRQGSRCISTKLFCLSESTFFLHLITSTNDSNSHDLNQNTGRVITKLHWYPQTVYSWYFAIYILLNILKFHNNKIQYNTTQYKWKIYNIYIYIYVRTLHTHTHTHIYIYIYI